MIRAQSKQSLAVASFCGSAYPPVSFVKDSFVYSPGETLILTDTIVFRDTVSKMINRYLTKYITRTDTVHITKQSQVVNRAHEEALNMKLEKVSLSLAKERQKNNILLWVVIVLGAYTLLRWILRTWIKLP